MNPRSQDSQNTAITSTTARKHRSKDSNKKMTMKPRLLSPAPPRTKRPQWRYLTTTAKANPKQKQEENNAKANTPPKKKNTNTTSHSLRTKPGGLGQRAPIRSPSGRPWLSSRNPRNKGPADRQRKTHRTRTQTNTARSTVQISQSLQDQSTKSASTNGILERTHKYNATVRTETLIKKNHDPLTKTETTLASLCSSNHLKKILKKPIYSLKKNDHKTKKTAFAKNNASKTKTTASPDILQYLRDKSKKHTPQKL